jgi:peptidyl-dipeptidase Dcp
MRKRTLLLAVIAMLVLLACSAQQQNPFFSEFDTPHGVPPFDKIKLQHYRPAFEEGMKRQLATIDEIANNPEPATFENTVVALERSGDLLTKVDNVFRGLNSANTNDEMQALAKEIAPLQSKHRDMIRFNEKLFARVEEVFEQRESLVLSPEQRKLLEDYYKYFVRGGAKLGPDEKAKLGEINEELSVLSLQFGENILKETNAFELVIENEEDLAGLPDAVIQGAAEVAAERGHEGTWVFTLHKPSMLPFLQYSKRRDLREKIFTAYINMGNNGDEIDNKGILARIAALRVTRANLLGYETYAHYILDENMAKEPRTVYDFLYKIWKPAVNRAEGEARMLQEMIDEEGGDFELEPWDWWYYAEKVKKAKYDIDEEMLRPYFELGNVMNGAFELATRLYGITFEERSDIPAYHEDVKAYEVKEADGTHIGILYTDYYPRASKRGGAWMGEYRSQSRPEGRMVTPVITNCGNFSKPTADTPALLSLDEVLTLFHEFGHALHGLLSECTYEMLSGTNVATDFVELPSQIMENWVTEPEMLKIYALHYRTGEPMPNELIDRIRNARLFNQGFAVTELLAASILDMDWHTLTEPVEYDPIAFENETFKRIGLIPEIVCRYRSPYFRHIFSSGYAAGYYSYIWAEVLDADAFQAFKEKGLFDRETGERFREHILATGGSEEPMILYKRFRGKEPSIEPLLDRRGLM